MKLSSSIVFFWLLFLMSCVVDGRNHYHHLQLQLPGVVGPESLAFDCNGEGPYTGVSDGRILKWQGSARVWTEFATTIYSRPREICDGSTDTSLEPVCGRPLGIKFNPATCDLYIVDAYFGLMMVGPDGGTAKQLASSAEGIPFRFLNAFDIDPATGVVYFTESSMYFQRRDYNTVVYSGDRSGRLLKYDPRSREATVIWRGLAFPNGVALSKDKSFLLLAESNTNRILRFWLHGGDTAVYPPQLFAQLSKFPDNIETDNDGGFWVALNTERGDKESDLVAVKLDENGNVVRDVNGNEGNALDSVSEVEKHDGYLFVGSSLQPYVVVIKA